MTLIIKIAQEYSAMRTNRRFQIYMRTTTDMCLDNLRILLKRRRAKENGLFYYTKPILKEWANPHFSLDIIFHWVCEKYHKFVNNATILARRTVFSNNVSVIHGILASIVPILNLKFLTGMNIFASYRLMLGFIFRLI
jgi:hypothetical protein